MTPLKRIIVAYDGSDCAGDALDDLSRAGLPEILDVVVLAMADVWLPDSPVVRGDASHGEEDESGSDQEVPGALEARNAIEEARRCAVDAASRLGARFPRWTFAAEARADAPAWGILSKSREWGADLIVLGTHGRGGIGRLIIGSVSQKVLAEAPCSVRIARQRSSGLDEPCRIVVGVDGTAGSDAAVAAVRERNWKPGSAVRIIAALDPGLQSHGTLLGALTRSSNDSLVDRERARLHGVLLRAEEVLRGSGLLVESEILPGTPVPVLTDAAEGWGADAIFVGASGHRLLERLSLGSVSSGLASRARCSVEVVRQRESVGG